MKSTPRIKGNICLNVNPDGCRDMVGVAVENLKRREPVSGPRHVLIIGGSTGYGLASRLVSAFSCGAGTTSVAYERPPEGSRNGTAGWYKTEAFERYAGESGLHHQSFFGDAFSHEMKDRVCSYLSSARTRVDLVVYSLASSVRRDPVTSEIYRGVIKPIGESVRGKTIDLNTVALKELILEPATDEEIRGTVKVMGGEDWEGWIEKLFAFNLLEPGAVTVAYSYIGPPLTAPLYRNGTLGEAKKHLEATGRSLNRLLSSIRGSAYVSVNKAVVTKSSAVIPVVPLYIAILYKVMKEKGLHENTIDQIYRLFSEKLYGNHPVNLDEGYRIRMDDYELQADVQERVSDLWRQVTGNNLHTLADTEGFMADFLLMSGFSLPVGLYPAG
ncbi:MAG: trans-2-enoyl-CoA reductase family protein [Spirochaetales bacterium]|nr:trans-2-enoyl-CoA reductase family protein [Spirochaetales bacterium]